MENSGTYDNPGSAAGTAANRKIWRSFRAVLAGALTGILLSVGTDAVLRATGIFPSQGGLLSNSLFILAAAYRTLYGIAGAYVAARLAPFRPMAHAIVLGAAGLAVNIAGTAATWNKAAEFGPHWYPLSLVVLAMPTAWLGAKLREMQLSTN